MTSGLPVVVVMGVAGTGKTTVGAELAAELGVEFADADGFHPAENIAKMTAGVPLDDADREPWLDAVGAWAAGRSGRGGVVGCSALKRRYRDRLRRACPGVVFLHLDGDPGMIAARLEGRRGHFMKSGMLGSQLADLEPLQADEVGLVRDVGAGVREIATGVAGELRERWGFGV